jgi:hypothetical protein
MKLPSKVSISTIVSAIVSIEQSGKEIISKDFSSMTKDTDTNCLSVKLTQEESLSLSAKNKAFVQLKVKDSVGTVLASFKMPIVVTDIVNEEVL